jgi:uncharacterized protein YjiS (DUF1127 family)
VDQSEKLINHLSELNFPNGSARHTMGGLDLVVVAVVVKTRKRPAMTDALPCAVPPHASRHAPSARAPHPDAVLRLSFSLMRDLLRLLAAHARHHRRQRADRAALRDMSALQLRDLGLGASDVDAVMQRRDWRNDA